MTLRLLERAGHVLAALRRRDRDEPSVHDMRGPAPKTEAAAARPR